MKKLIMLSILLFWGNNAFCQGSTICGLWYDSLSNVHFVTVENLTGQMNYINSLPSLSVGKTGVSIIMADSNQYIFGGWDTSTIFRYYTIDILTGNIVNNPLGSENLFLLQIDPGTNKIYGLWFENSIYQFVSLNHLTGQITYIDTLQNVATIGTAVFNPNTGQYIFEGKNDIFGNGRIYTVNALTGAIVNDTLAQDGLNMMQIDTADGKIYGLQYDGFNHHLASIDPQSGLSTDISTLFDVEFLITGTAIFNSATKHYIFRGIAFGDPVDVQRYYTIDALTGSIVNDTLAPDDIRMLELYQETNTSINEERNQKNYFLIYPNPFHDRSILEFKNIKNEKHRLSLYSITGKLMRSVTDITTNYIVIERKNLANGLYFFQLRNNKQIVATGKLIIE